jgi:hypothetical protein
VVLIFSGAQLIRPVMASCISHESVVVVVGDFFGSSDKCWLSLDLAGLEVL